MQTLDILFLDGINRGDVIKSFVGYIPPLAAELEIAGYTFKVLNINTLSDYSLNGILTELQNIDFRCIGMTTNSENIANVYKICAFLKEHYPQLPIILGGPQVTFSDVETLEKCNCDIVIRNRGEKKIIDLLSIIKSNTYNKLAEIDGISFRKGNEIIRTKEELTFNIDMLPTPQYGVYHEQKYWIVPENCCYKNFQTFLDVVVSDNDFFITGRGCPYNCNFCVEGNIHSKYMFRSIGNVKKDLKRYLSVTKNKHILFADDTFTSSPSRVNELCEVIKELQKEEHYFTWFAEGRVDVLSNNPDLIGIMYDAGLRKLQLGIESGRQETLDAYNKKITLLQIENVIKETSKYEWLAVHGNIMMANPKESFEEYLPTIDFFEKLLVLSKFKLDVGVAYLAPFVGTPIRTDPDKFGIELLVDDFEFNSSAMGSIACKSNKMTLSETYALRNYTYSRLMSFLRSKVFELGKEKLISLNNLAFITHSGSLFKSAIKKMYSIERFFKLTTSKETVAVPDRDVVLADTYPLRLWELEYTADKGFYFMALSGEEFCLKDRDADLWELASGKNTISDIYNMINEKYNISMDRIIDFYRRLDENCALVFRSN